MNIPSPSLAPDIKDLDSLIDLGKDGVSYSNIDCMTYYKIRPILIELQSMVGMKEVKKSIFEMVIFYLQHLHIPVELSYLYSPKNPVSKPYSRYLEAVQNYKKTLETLLEEEDKRRKAEIIKASDDERKRMRKKRFFSETEDGDRTQKESEEKTRRGKKAKIDTSPAPPSISATSSSSGTPEVPPLRRSDNYKDLPTSSLGSHVFGPPSLLNYPYLGDYIKTEGCSNDYHHMIICGPPGTGKTTVGQIIGKIISHMGILKTKHVFPVFSVVHRSDLVGEYLGQTAAKTTRVLDAHRGGVLMIDEAYSLGDSSDKYAVEAMNTITSYLSDHKDDIVVIFVGYKDYIFERLLTMNKGLERRIPWIHHIEGYTSKELYAMFSKRVSEYTGWSLSKDISKEEGEALFEKYKDTFSNYGGDIENLVTRCKKKASIYSFSKDICERRTITKDILVYEIKHLKDGLQEEKKVHLQMYT